MYKKITIEELDTFLRKHKLWLDCKEGGERADLYGADLRGADLRGANLRGADLRGANLRGADLRGANLREADLYGADLRGADLRGANLREANLYGADLRGANLYGADLYGADLREANLREADLCGAHLYGANLREANLRGANLYGADLYGAKNLHLPITCPEEGEFIGFKKASGYIVKLKITEDAKRCSATSRKCRCSKAVVLSITTIEGKDEGITEVSSSYDSKFTYKVGETVEVKDFCDDRWKECSAGIHFFITRKEAEEY